MNTERDQLVKSLEMTSSKLDSLNAEIWEKEISIQKRMDQLEKLVQGYNTRAYKLGLLGSSLADLASVRNELELRIHSTRPDKMVSIDLKNKVKPTLISLKSKYNAQSHAYQDESIALSESLDSVNWSITQKEEELQELESQINHLTDRYKNEKQVISSTSRTHEY